MNTPARVSRIIVSSFVLGSLLVTPSAYVAHVFAQEQTAQPILTSEPSPPVPVAIQPPSVAAQQSLSLTATPLRYGDDDTLVISPGEKKQIKVEVINTSDVPLTVVSTARDFIVEDGETPVPLESGVGDNRWSLASWLVLTPNQHTLQPRQKASITVLIDVPADALPGGHYAMVSHQPSLSSAKGTEGKAAGINQRVGTLLYVRVAGPINESANIRNFTIPKYSEFGPVPYSFTIDNLSDIHIRPQIGISIKNLFGKQVALLQPEAKNIFPLSNRSYSGKWEQIWGYGYYHADLVVSYGAQGDVVIAKTAFWLIPIKLVLALFIMLLTAVAAGISIRRHLKHRKQDQNARIAELEAKLNEAQGQDLKQYEE